MTPETRPSDPFRPLAHARGSVLVILLLGVTLPASAQKGTTPPASPAPTPVRGVYDPMQDPRKNGMADSGPASAATTSRTAGESVSVTTLAAPPEARAAYDKG